MIDSSLKFQSINTIRRETLRAKNVLFSLFQRRGNKKVLLVNYTGFEANHGCIATSAALTRLIERAWPGAALRITPVRFAPPETSVTNDVQSFIGQARDFVKLEKSWFDSFDWADLIVFNGEGSMHEYESPDQNQCFLARLMQLYAGKNIFSKKVLSVNQTFEFSESLTGVVRRCLDSLDLVSVREPDSYDRLERLGMGNLRLSADAAFLTRPAVDEKADAFLKNKKISERFACMFLSETIQNCAPEKTAELISGISRRLGLEVVLIATTAMDRVHAQKIRRKTAVRTIGLEVSPGELISMLGRADLVLSGRYHCCIFAFLAGVPFLPFYSNSSKINGLMRLMRYPVKVCDYAADPNSAILNEAESVYSRAEELKRQMAKIRPHLIALAEAALYPAGVAESVVENRLW